MAETRHAKERDNLIRQPSEERRAKEVVERRKRREKLLVVRLFLAKLSLVTSSVTLIITITNIQLILLNVYSTCSDESLILKTVVSALTAFLLLLIWLYNYVQLEIFRNLRRIENIRMALQVNPQRIVLLLIETLITLPHPLPFCLLPVVVSEVSPFFNEHEDQEVIFNATTPAMNISSGLVGLNPHPHMARINQLDSVFAMLMFSRLYHIARFTVLHSKLFRTMISYSLGALAHTKYNFMFIFKSYMAIYKGYFLALLALSFTFIAAWCIYICDKDITKYEDALWVVGITFFTVGYGDISPVSRYSQLIAVLTGFSGMFFMGISVTILSRYLQLTYDEYCMLAFFVDADLQKKRREVSAKIIQAAWKQHRDGRTLDGIARFKCQRNLIKALHLKKSIEYQKVSGRERREKQVTSGDLSVMFCSSSDVPLYDMKEQMKKLTIRTDHVFAREANLEKSIELMRSKLLSMQEKLAQLCKILQKEKRAPLTTTISLPSEGDSGHS